ncbi:MAG: DnaJ family molecular chaperone [Bauldia sp.]|nr:DnaJ family molecular chaperone [Bauldia sp.]
MSVWQRIGEVAGNGAEAVGALLEWFSAVVAGVGDPAVRREVAFSVALIALSAKMAKADGVVTADEVSAFRGIFSVPESEAANVARLFDLAKRDVAGYDAYAARIAALYADNRDGLADVIDGLFAIAKADGAVHEAEFEYLRSVAAIFGIEGLAFERIAARHVVPEEGDPYLVLGAERSWTFTEIRARYRQLVAENHPDRSIARGLPPDFITIATDRMAAVNRAFERIELERGKGRLS